LCVHTCIRDHEILISHLTHPYAACAAQSARGKSILPGKGNLDLLVDLALEDGVPVGDLVGLEPEGELGLGSIGGVGAVADVAADLNGEVAADGAREGVGGVGGAEEGAAALDDAEARPAHGDDGARREVVDEGAVEGLGREVDVVGLGLLLGGSEHLEAHQLVALLLEASNDSTNEGALDTVGLDGDEGALILSAGNAIVGDLSRHDLLKR